MVAAGGLVADGVGLFYALGLDFTDLEALAS